MRKKLLSVFTIFSIVALTGCGSMEAATGTKNDTTSTASSTEATLQELVEQANSTDESTVDTQTANTSDSSEDASLGELTDEEETADADPNVDIDLTAMSSTVVYSQVYDMMNNPQNYVGQTVKMTGTANVYMASADNIYYSCIITDATACCAQGVEYVLSDDYDNADYGQMGEEITVTGTFATYLEDGITYATLVDAEII